MKIKNHLMCFFIVLCASVMLFAGGSSEATSNTASSDNLNAEGLPILKEKETFTIAIQQTSALKD